MKRNMLLVTLVLAATSSMATRIHLAIVHFQRQNHQTRCGGSIISANLVLTSAHCFYHTSHSGQSFEMYLPEKVRVTSGFKRDHRDEFVYSYAFKVSELLSHPNVRIESLNANNRIEFDIGLVRLETPINFGTYQNLNSVKLARPTDQFQADKCVLESWNRPSEQVHRVRVTLQEGVLPGVLTSPLVGLNKDGYPVICPSTEPNSVIQVAVVAGNISQYNIFARVPPSYQWIEAYIVGQSMHQPSRSQMRWTIRSELDDPRNHPHLVVVNILKNRKWKRCGGSIISANWVLTSAHCLFHPPDSRGLLVLYEPTQVAVSREYKENNKGRFNPKLACGVSELIPHNEYLQHWNDSKRENQTLYDLGLVRLKIPNEFANSSKNAVKIDSPTDFNSSTGCVLAGWNQPVTHLEVHKATLTLQYEDGVYKSQLDLDKMDGYPVLCPTSPNSMVQVAVVSRYSMMTLVFLYEQWIQSHLSGIAAGSAGHQHSGRHKRPSSLIRPGSPAVNRTHLVIVSIVRNGRRKQCGGSIITANYVLTSAGCMFNTSVSRKPKEIYLPSEVTVSSEYEKNSFGQFQPMYESKASKLIPHRFYSEMVKANAAAKCAIGLIHLETPINFTRFLNLAPVQLPSSPDQYKMNGCVMEHFNERYHPSQTPVTLNESETNLFTSPTKFDKNNIGNPVFCPGISSPPYQVAVVVVVGRGTKHVSKFSIVSLNYEWILNELHSVTNVAQNHVFHSHLVIVIFKRGNELKRCSGSVLNSHYVLTAAHCFYSSSSEMFDPYNTTIFGGFHIKNYTTQFNATIIKKKVDKFILPENYQNDSPERAKYDIGLVKFGNRTRLESYMMPVKLADSVEKLDMSQCLWAGWPNTHRTNIVNHQTSLELSVADSPQIFTSRPVFGVNNGDHNQGGPVLCPSKSNPKHLEQVAVAIETNPNGYRYIAVPSYLSWIRSKNISLI